MPRGGKRPGAGGKSSWLHGKTKTIRVPVVLADRILQLAHFLDEGRKIDDVTQSKYVDLSGVSLRYVKGKPAVLVEDLISKGFKVRPLALADDVRKRMDIESF